MVLWVYFDETGHPSDPNVRAFGIGGLSATRERWQSFNAAWESILAEKGIRVFHMKEFYSGGHQPYASWSDGQKMAFLLRLVDVIEMVKPPLGAMQSLPDDMSQRDRIDEAYRQSYHACIRAAIHDVASFDKVHFVFAKYPEISPVLLKQYHGWTIDGYRQVFDDHRLGTITFGEPRDLPALQASDFLSWELQRHVRDPEQPLRPTMQRLLAMRPRIYR